MLPFPTPAYVNDIPNPALAYPVNTEAIVKPVDSSPKASNRRVPAVTGTLSAVVPLSKSPRLMIPENGKLTTAPGICVNVLSGVVDSYSCAVTDKEPSVRLAPTVTLKYAAKS